MSSKATNQTDSARPLILLVFLGLCWSLRLLAIKHTADSGAKPIDIALVATLAIVVLLLVINLARSRSLPKTSEHLKFYGLAGIFGFGAPFLAEATVAAHLPALVFVIIIATTPILTLLLSVVMRIERSSLIRVLGTLIGFLAVAVVIFTTQTNGRANDQPVQAFWIVAAFSIPLLYALYLLYIANRWPENLDNLQGALGQTTAGLIMYFGIWAFSRRQFGDIASLAMEWPIWAVIVSEVTALVLLFRIARLRGGSFVSQANYIAVVAGAALSAMLFGQPFSWAIVIGIALLLISMRLSMKKIESGF